MSQNKKQKYVTKKGADELRKYSVSVRMNQFEIDRLDYLRGDISRGNYVRTIFFGDQRQKIVPEINVATRRQLIRTLSNLNQIAHHLNAKGSDSLAVDDVKAALTDVCNALYAVTFVDTNDAEDDEDESQETTVDGENR